jgi:hypothetical protein
MEISGDLRISNGRLASKSGGRRWAMGLHVTSAKIGSLELVDLAPLLWGGYWIPLQPVDINSDLKFIKVDDLSIDATSSVLKAKFSY